jgi:hypothetical protein
LRALALEYLKEELPMNEPVSRRDALRNFALLFGAAVALQPGESARAADLPHLAASDASATALGYHEDAKTVDVKAFTNYQPGQLCSNCVQLQGTDGQPWRPCNIFPGKLVSANGWCRVYTKKT